MSYPDPEKEIIYKQQKAAEQLETSGQYVPPSWRTACIDVGAIIMILLGLYAFVVTVLMIVFIIFYALHVGSAICYATVPAFVRDVAPTTCTGTVAPYTCTWS